MIWLIDIVSVILIAMSNYRLRQQATRRFGSVVLAMLLFAGCANGATDTDGGAATTRQLGALSEFVFRITGVYPDESPEAMEARLTSEERAREEFISVCMAEHGFVYLPNLGTRISVTVVSAEQGVNADTRAFAEEFGFGISTGLSVRNADSISIRSEMGADPNAAALALMSVAERAAWEAALWGEVQDGSWDPALAGCADAAHRAASHSVEFPAIQAEIDRFWVGLTFDTAPEFAALNAEWVACMATEGFSGSQSPSLLRQSLVNELMTLRGGVVEVDEYGVTSVTWPNFTDMNPAGLPAFTEREIATAVANYDCESRVDYDQRRHQINLALQQEFVDRHRNELEAWAEYAEAIRAGR